MRRGVRPRGTYTRRLAGVRELVHRGPTDEEGCTTGRLAGVRELVHRGPTDEDPRGTYTRRLAGGAGPQGAN